MADDTQHGNPEGHGSFEHEDLSPRSILYFLLILGAGTLFCIFFLGGVYKFLDKRAHALQPPVNPLITNAPEDTRHIAPGYPQTVFPDPKLEEDERGQLNAIRMAEEKTLYSYGWVNEQEGVVHIPIDRAMDLLVQRGLPVRPQQASNGDDGNSPASEARSEAKKK
jgi:hypothetical protein